MNSRRILLHPFFLLNLALLLANDLFLKTYYHNWLTGKLSDFSGIIVLTIFLFAFFPYHKRSILIIVTTFFIWWKSPFSETFIQFANSTLKLPINRVVDFTDLSALLVLPFLFFWKIDTVQIRIKFSKLSYNLVLILSLFAFCYTSMPYNRYYYEEQSTYFDKYYKSTKEESEIINDLSNAGLEFRKDSIKLLPAYDVFLHKIV